ncbi:glycosyltransferase family 2 protein [Thalassotalea sp. PS06]|uniref:glycosyltransferase family 2 protein n=1 Tax=Thalassotalea sp. PS06 TaxID=2594005 RepID=UPI001163220A|nr:glycosyltransferase family 2 protein [Thalassotalea sp. PS06]QDP01790.1 glycosyltransferase family 2 protein [Thalassotalea sp. PS06]
MLTQLKSWLYAPVVLVEQIRARKAASEHYQQLDLVQDNLDAIEKNDILLFATLFNEAHLLPSFLKHYRSLGVNHFIFIDNNSSDQGTALVTMDNDVSVFHTKASYKQANFGMHWVNGLLQHYGCEHWCLTCDLDEHLIIGEQRGGDDSFEKQISPLESLCKRLETEPQKALYAMMLDMYPRQSDNNFEGKKYPPENDLKVTTPYFDKSGYQYRFNNKYLSQMIRGGVRQRLFYSEQPNQAPALQKIPLVKWQSSYAYLSSMHTLSPRRLNLCYQQNETAALLHYKFAPGFEVKVQQEETRRQHYDNSSEYNRYQQMQNPQVLFDDAISLSFSGAEQLIGLGLIKSRNDSYQGSDFKENPSAGKDAVIKTENTKTKVMRNG